MLLSKDTSIFGKFGYAPEANNWQHCVISRFDTFAPRWVTELGPGVVLSVTGPDFEHVFSIYIFVLTCHMLFR